MAQEFQRDRAFYRTLASAEKGLGQKATAISGQEP